VSDESWAPLDTALLEMSYALMSRQSKGAVRKSSH
jgi:hypothetical protein